jgi:hypothetical protein
MIDSQCPVICEAFSSLRQSEQLRNLLRHCDAGLTSKKTVDQLTRSRFYTNSSGIIRLKSPIPIPFTM